MSPGPEQVRKQVDRVLHSRTFQTSEVHRHLLEYLDGLGIRPGVDRNRQQPGARDALTGNG